MTWQNLYRTQFWRSPWRDWRCQNSFAHIHESVLHTFDGWWRDECCKWHHREHLLRGLPRPDLQWHQNDRSSLLFGAHYCSHFGGFAHSWLVFVSLLIFPHKLYIILISVLRLKEAVERNSVKLCDIQDALEPTLPALDISQDESENWTQLTWMKYKPSVNSYPQD